MLSEDPKKDSTFPLFHRLSFGQMFRFGNPPDYQPRRENSLEAIAKRQGRRQRTGLRLCWRMTATRSSIHRSATTPTTICR